MCQLRRRIPVIQLPSLLALPAQHGTVQANAVAPTGGAYVSVGDAGCNGSCGGPPALESYHEPQISACRLS